jgi:O-antigen ligase
MTDHTTSTAERVAWYSLLLAPALVPLAVFPPILTPTNPYGNVSFIVPKLFVLGLLLAVSLIAWATALVGGNLAVRRVPFMWWFLGFGAILVVSTATALNRTTAVFGASDNQVGLLTFVICAALFFLTIQLVTSLDRMTWMARSAAYGGAGVALIGIFQALGLGSFGMNLADGWMFDRAVSTIGNPDLTGTYLVLPLVLAATLFICEEDMRWRAAAGGAAVATALALFLTLTRGAWVGAFVGLCVLAVVLVRSSRIRARLLVLVLAGIGIVVVVASALNYSAVVGRLADFKGGWASIGGGRLFVWQEALAVIARHPLLGVGPDSYRLGWFPVRTLTDVAAASASSVANDPHSVVLLLSATLGIPGALVALCVFAIAMVSGAPRAFDRSISRERLIYSGWWAALAALSIGLFFSVNTIVAMLEVSVAVAVLVTPRAKSWEPGVLSRRSLAGAAVAVALVAAVVPMMTFISEYTLALGATANPSLPLVSQALAQAPWNFDARNMQAYYASGAAVDALANGDPQAKSLFDQADRLTAALIAADPYEYDSYYTRARLLTDAGRFLGAPTLEQAVSVADAGLAVQPNSVLMRTQKALALYELKRYPEMVATLAPVWNADPKFAQSGTLYAEALILSGRKQDAVQILDELRLRFPTDAEVTRVTGLLTAP